MANPLLTGISGLRGHQKMLEVIGNNLANLNSIGFKSSRVLFSDLLYESQRDASSGSGPTIGSVNPLQVGTGTQVDSIDTNFTQGNLQQTGEPLDLAISGKGFLVARSGNQTLYTRAGALGLDESGFLIDPTHGTLIQRFGTLGEPGFTDPAFQVPGDNRIRIPMGATVPGAPTSSVYITGNLPANSNGPQAQQLTSIPLTTGSSQTNADASTLLVDLNPQHWGDGDVISFSGLDTDGTPIPSGSDTYTVTGASSTLGDLRDAIAAVLPGSTVSIVNGELQIEADTTGPSSLSFSFTDGAAVGFSRTVEGKTASKVSGTLPVFDQHGLEHNLQYTLEKQSDASWTLTAALPSDSGTVNDALVEGIRFGDNGVLSQVNGVGAGDANIELLFSGATSPLTVQVMFTTENQVGALTQTGNSTTLSVDTNGYPPGQITDLEIDSDGTISAIGSNSVQIPLAQLAIASFRNPDGLISTGNNYFRSSLASGDPAIGTAQSGDRGSILSRQLEVSNVDLALEFTRLIVAQRGFSANARTITVTDEVLQELTNIIR